MLAPSLSRKHRNVSLFGLLLLGLFVLPVMAYAGDRCEPDDVIANVVAQKGNSLSGPFTVEELQREHRIVIRETGQDLPPRPAVDEDAGRHIGRRYLQFAL